MTFYLFCFLLFYQLLLLLSIPLFVFYLCLRRIKKKSVFGSLKERLGFVPYNHSNKATYWFHAVSVGEVLSIEGLIKHITNDKHETCFITTGTLGGRAIAEKSSARYKSFIPYDVFIPMLIAFWRIKPKALILVEAEIWPTLLILAHFFNIPCYLINARITTLSLPKKLWMKLIGKHLLRSLKMIYAQTVKEQKKFQEIGVPASHLSLMGNIKSYNVWNKRLQYLSTYNPAYPTLMAGSIHPKEDEYYLLLFQRLKTLFPTLKLILIPRHTYWQETFINNIARLPYRYTIWYQENERFDITSALDENDIIGVCKLGVMFDLYQHSSLFFLGGTLVPIGGHNLLEPAVWGIPMIVGPFHKNCQEQADQLEQVNALVKITYADDLYRTTHQFLSNPHLLDTYKKNTLAWIRQDAITTQEHINMFLSKLTA